MTSNTTIQNLIAHTAHSMLDTMTCWLIFVMARRMWNRRVALMGAAIYALNPGAWLMCSRYLTEPLFIFLTALFVYLLARYLDNKSASSLILAAICCIIRKYLGACFGAVLMQHPYPSSRRSLTH